MQIEKKAKKAKDDIINFFYAFIISLFIILFGILHKNSLVLKLFSLILLLCAFVLILISIKPKNLFNFLNSFRLINFSKKSFLIEGALIGIVYALIYKILSGDEILPLSLGIFSFFAVLIGASEELIFRGFIQKKISFNNRFIAVILASFFHTVYKACLFIGSMNFLSLFLFFLITFFGGILFGIIVESSDNVCPAMLGHSIFDLLIYGQLNQAPWWVW